MFSQLFLHLLFALFCQFLDSDQNFLSYLTNHLFHILTVIYWLLLDIAQVGLILYLLHKRTAYLFEF